jgi:hypothetical protein
MRQIDLLAEPLRTVIARGYGNRLGVLQWTDEHGIERKVTGPIESLDMMVAAAGVQASGLRVVLVLEGREVGVFVDAAAAKTYLVGRAVDARMGRTARVWLARIDTVGPVYGFVPSDKDGTLSLF